MLSEQKPVQLVKFIHEIETNLRIDPSLWSQTAYYRKLLLKAKLVLYSDLLQIVYFKFVKENEGKIKDELEKAQVKKVNVSKNSGANYSSTFSASLGIGNITSDHVGAPATMQVKAPQKKAEEEQKMSVQEVTQIDSINENIRFQTKDKKAGEQDDSQVA